MWAKESLSLTEDKWGDAQTTALTVSQKMQFVAKQSHLLTKGGTKKVSLRAIVEDLKICRVHKSNDAFNEEFVAVPVGAGKYLFESNRTVVHIRWLDNQYPHVGPGDSILKW